MQMSYVYDTPIGTQGELAEVLVAYRLQKFLAAPEQLGSVGWLCQKGHRRLLTAVIQLQRPPPLPRGNHERLRLRGRVQKSSAGSRSGFLLPRRHHAVASRCKKLANGRKKLKQNTQHQLHYRASADPSGRIGAAGETSRSEIEIAVQT